MTIDGTQFVVSMLGGGLAGGCINTVFNRIFYWRGLRIKFYPQLSHIFSTYRIRMETPEDRYLMLAVSEPPLPLDANFVRHRSVFISELIDFTELKEVRGLRQKLLSNMEPSGSGPKGTLIKIDLKPESDALFACVKKVQEKLRLS
jgi:hypothetical protein